MVEESPTGYPLHPFSICCACIFVPLLCPLYLSLHTILVSPYFLLDWFCLYQTMHFFLLLDPFSIWTLFMSFPLSILTILYHMYWPTNQLQRRSAQWSLLLMRSFISLDSSRQSTFQTITFTIASTRLYSWHPLYPGTCWLSRSRSHKLALARGSEAHSLDCLQTWEHLHLDSNWARSPWWAILSSSQDSNHTPYALGVIKYSHSSFHVGWYNTDYQGPDSIQSLQPPIIPTGSVYSSRMANHYASSMTPSFSMQSQSMTHPHLYSSSTSWNPSLDLQCTEWWTCWPDMTNACCIQNSGTLWHSTVPWVLTASPQFL